MNRASGGCAGQLSLTRGAFLVGFGALIARAQTAEAGKEENGFESLFDGRELGEWVGDPKQWTVNNGVIVGNSDDRKLGSTLTFSNRDFLNFELRFDVRVIKGAGGLSVRGLGREPLGVQVEVNRDQANWLLNGVLATPACNVKPREWNSLGLIARGVSFSLSNNGVPANLSVAASHEAAAGKLSLMLSWQEPSEVQFRNLRIKTLPL